MHTDRYYEHDDSVFWNKIHKRRQNSMAPEEFIQRIREGIRPYDLKIEDLNDFGEEKDKITPPAMSMKEFLDSLDEENRAKLEETGTARDSVYHPEHYKTGKYECIDVMLDVFGADAVENFCYLNAFKYIWRAQEKNGLEDLKKAKWYLEKIIDIELK